MAREEVSFLENIISNDETINQMVSGLSERYGDNKIDRIIDDAINTAYDIDNTLRPNQSIENILADTFAAYLGSECSKSLNWELPHNVEKVVRDVDDAMRQMSNQKSGGFGQRNNNNSGGFGQKGGGFGNRSKTFGQNNNGGGFTKNTRRDEANQTQAKVKGFGKLNKRNVEVEEVAVAPQLNVYGRSHIFDKTRFTISNGALVETYEEHSLKENTYQRPRIEEVRRTFIERKQASPDMNLEDNATIQQFLAKEFDGLAVQLVNHEAMYPHCQQLDDFIANAADDNIIQFVFKLLTATNDIDNTTVKSFYRRLDRIAKDALYMAFNMYSKIQGDMSKSALEEWVSVQTLFGDVRFFNEGDEVDVRNALNGILLNYARIANDSTQTTLTSRHLITRASGEYINTIDMIGDDRMVTLAEEYHPELYTVATAAIEIRDAVIGDGWSSIGLLPLIVVDDTDELRFILSNKATSTKQIMTRYRPSASILN